MLENVRYHHYGHQRYLVILLQGLYVLVMVATSQTQRSNKLPAMWLISAFRNLSRPFRKNVRYILLVRPTGGLKALVACIRPFVSAKAAKKVRKVRQQQNWYLYHVIRISDQCMGLVSSVCLTLCTAH